MKPEILILDADDTLWESALFFERAEEDFLLLMKALGLDTASVRQLVHRRDLERLSLTGYGARPYLGTLRAVMGELCPARPGWADRAFEEIGRSLLTHPVILLPGALQALEWIAASGLRALVYTMGENEHQTDKFRRSGLDALVPECVVVERKTPEALRKLLDDRGIGPDRCLVVGNSPRSDVNPALQIGARAVLCARERLWQAEKEEILDPSQVHRIECLDELPGLLSVLSSPV